MIEEDDLNYFNVPLIEASFASKVDTAGWVGWIKNKVKRFSSIDEIKKLAEDVGSQFLDTESEKESTKD